MIVVVDYGIGNCNSILNLLRRLSRRAVLSSQIDDIKKAGKLIFAGVGSFDAAINNLRDLNLVAILNEKVLNDKVPILGICLGMQLFMKKSEEGNAAGLGWVNGEARRFDFGAENPAMKIPHMGWNTVKIAKKTSLFNNFHMDPRFYFAHSYHVVCEDEKDILTKTFHGYDFISSIEKGNIIGVQFHPEKSHRFGMQLFKNFVESY